MLMKLLSLITLTLCLSLSILLKAQSGYDLFTALSAETQAHIRQQNNTRPADLGNSTEFNNPNWTAKSRENLMDSVKSITHVRVFKTRDGDIPELTYDNSYRLHSQQSIHTSRYDEKNRLTEYFQYRPRYIEDSLVIPPIEHKILYTYENDRLHTVNQATIKAEYSYLHPDSIHITYTNLNSLDPPNQHLVFRLGDTIISSELGQGVYTRYSEYQYNQLGNLLTSAYRGGQRYYTYNQDNQLISWIDASQKYIDGELTTATDSTFHSLEYNELGLTSQSTYVSERLSKSETYNYEFQYDEKGFFWIFIKVELQATNRSGDFEQKEHYLVSWQFDENYNWIFSKQTDLETAATISASARQIEYRITTD